MKQKIVALFFTALGMFGLSPSAFAALPAEVGTSITALLTDVGLMFAALWPLWVAVTVGFLLPKMFKRGVSRA